MHACVQVCKVHFASKTGYACLVYTHVCTRSLCYDQGRKFMRHVDVPKGVESLPSGKVHGDAEETGVAWGVRARQAAPAIIFIDELDGLTMARDMHGRGSDTSSRVLSQLLTELDGLQVSCSHKATNRHREEAVIAASPSLPFLLFWSSPPFPPSCSLRA